MSHQFVLLGASGVFGQRVLYQLLKVQEVQIGVVCRKKTTALALARRFGPRVTPLWGDIHQKKEVLSLVQGAQTLLHCAGPFRLQPLLPLEVALENHQNYADLGDDPAYLKKAYQLISERHSHNALVIPGASSLPSMTSLLCSMAEHKMGPIQKISIRVFIGNRNPKGGSAIDYLIHALRNPFQEMRNGQWCPQGTWLENVSYRSPFYPTTLPFSRIESPDDIFLPKWFRATETSFYVSLEFLWIHRTIALIKTLQGLLPDFTDSFWVNLLFYGHPWIRQFGTKNGWLEVSTTHNSGSTSTIFTQQLEGPEEGQRVPTFPMSFIARLLASGNTAFNKHETRFFALCSGDQFLAEVGTEGIVYRQNTVNKAA